jgi:hypothetical protein
VTLPADITNDMGIVGHIRRLPEQGFHAEAWNLSRSLKRLTIGRKLWYALKWHLERCFILTINEAGGREVRIQDTELWERVNKTEVK